jgi:hypothetical protein
VKDELLRVDAFSGAGKLLGCDRRFEDRDGLVFIDYGLIPLMVAEGYIETANRPRPACSDALKLERCAKAAEYLGEWDILDRRIHTSQQWTTLPYAVSAIVRAASVCNGSAPFQLFPSWLGKNSKRLKHRRWYTDIRQRTRLDSSMYDSVNVLRNRFFKPGQTALHIVDSLVDMNLTRDDMMETLTETIYKGDENTVALDTKTKGQITREWKRRAIPEFTKEKCQDISEDSYESDSDTLEDME